MSRVAQAGSLRSLETASKNMPWLLIGWAGLRMLSMNEGIVSAR